MKRAAPRFARAACLSGALLGLAYALAAFVGPLFAHVVADPHPRRDTFAAKPTVERMPVDEALAALEALDVGTTAAIVRANALVAAGMASYWPAPGEHDDALDCMFIEQPDLWIRQRWLEWSGADHDGLDRIRRRERVAWRTAPRIGVGYCSQQAMVIAAYLRERGVEARVMGLDGHVVAVVETPDGRWVFDPDYGVVIPATLEELAANPQLVRKVYGDAGYPEASLVELAGIYSKGEAREYGGTMIGQLASAADGSRHAALWGGLACAALGLRLRPSARHADGADGVATGHRDPA